MQEEMKKTLFEECGKRFNKEESPLEWFVNHDCENIIVLSKQTWLYDSHDLSFDGPRDDIYTIPLENF